jgi:hypothetical protein
VASATAPSLGDAVSRAAEAIAARIAGAPSAGGPGRLELDFPVALEAARVDDDLEVTAAKTGLEGFFVVADDGKSGFVLPGEVVERGMMRDGRLDHAAIAALLAERAGVTASELGSMRAYRFRADAHVEGALDDRAPPFGATGGATGAEALHLVRGKVEPAPGVTPEGLLAAVRNGADYLARVLDGAGRYVYLYHPTDDRDDPQYGWLRHAGTTYALLEAYEEFRSPVYLAKAELALRYLGAHLVSDPSSEGKYVVDADDELQQRVGGAALALLAWSERATVTGQRDAIEPMRSLARFILKQQYADGHFRSNADLEHDSGKKLKREAPYYPGEAVLALVRLYAIDPQPAYLEAARAGANYVIGVRDAYASEDNQEHDHWMSYADGELYRLTGDERYAQHAFKIARAIRQKQHRADDAPAPDFAGTFYDGQVTAGSTRLEAFDADIALSRFARQPEEWLVEPAREIARATLGQQFDDRSTFWLPNPAKVRGGVPESPFVHDVRIDYVQHAMSAWLHLARLLRDPRAGGANPASD